MAEQQTPAAIARAFTEAWTGRDMTRAATYLAQDVVFDGPSNHLSGAADYMRFLSKFASGVTSARVLAAFGDETQAIVMYEVTNAAGTWTCAELLTFNDGKIQVDTLTFSLNQAR